LDVHGRPRGQNDWRCWARAGIDPSHRNAISHPNRSGRGVSAIAARRTLLSSICGVDRFNRNAGDPIRMDIGLRQRLVDAGLADILR
jgi:hypothetical protein